MRKEKTILHPTHMPKDSILFEKVVPILLLILGLITLGMVLFATGVLLGLVKF